MENKRVLIGMSGGVDSSVAAILLKEKGYEVVGITLQMYKKENENIDEDAKSMCEFLGIEYHSYDCSKEFNHYVIDDFISCYKNCKTPNPCIECNKYMKFGIMAEKAKELNCSYIATGHYASIQYSEKYGRHVLKKSKAGYKDQSYVLWSIDKNLLPNIIFPLSEFKSKDEIRKIAMDRNLKVANKPDSEDICFIEDGDYKRFLEEHSNMDTCIGNIVNTKNMVLGKHNGLHRYTIGQRRGLGISNKTPLFVLGFNKDKNEVIVGEEEELFSKEILVTDVNLLLIDKLTSPMDVTIKTRYSSKEAKGTIYPMGENIKVVFDEPQRAVTPGQSAVFYTEDIVVGGGKIV